MDNIKSLIERRRRQILVHSYIYYELDKNLISDEKWSTWAKELAELQEKYPDVADSAALAKEFIDFDYSTGCNLQYNQPWVRRVAEDLLRTSEKG